MQAVVGVGQIVALFENGEMDLLVGSAQCEVAGFAGLGFHTAQIFIHHEATRGHHQLSG